MRCKVTFWPAFIPAALVIIFGGVVNGQQVEYSDEFLNLLKQVEEQYVGLSGWSCEDVVYKHSGALAVMLGHALRQQLQFIQADSLLIKDYAGLQLEVYSFLSQVYGFIDDYSALDRRLTESKLWSYAFKAQHGYYDDYIRENFSKAAGIQSVFGVEQQYHSPYGGSYAASSSCLLDVVTGNQDPSYGYGGRHKDPYVKRTKLQPGDIVGTWENKDCRLTIVKDRVFYVGTITQCFETPSYVTWVHKAKPHTEAFRVRFIGYDNQGYGDNSFDFPLLVYSGTYNIFDEQTGMLESVNAEVRVGRKAGEIILHNHRSYINSDFRKVK